MKSIFFILFLLKFSHSEKVTSEAKQDLLIPSISTVMIKYLKNSVDAHPHSLHAVLQNI